MCWNVHGDLTAKLSSPEFREKLDGYDIIILQETHMRQDEELPIEPPIGFKLLSWPRIPKTEWQRRGGGIMVLVRKEIECKTVVLHSSADIFVLDMVNFWLVCAYIPPASSRWQGWTDIAPEAGNPGTLIHHPSVNCNKCMIHNHFLCRVQCDTSHPCSPYIPLPGENFWFSASFGRDIQALYAIVWHPSRLPPFWDFHLDAPPRFWWPGALLPGCFYLGMFLKRNIWIPIFSFPI